MSKDEDRFWSRKTNATLDEVEAVVVEAAKAHGLRMTFWCGLTADGKIVSGTDYHDCSDMEALALLGFLYKQAGRIARRIDDEPG